MSRRGELLAGGALVLAAVLGWALLRTYPGYDSYFALLWGREIRHGFGPAYEVYAAPTPHPLWTATAALAGLFGRHGDRVLILVTVVSWAASVWGVARLGAALWDGARGLLAAFFLATSSAFLLYAGKGFVDVPFVALVVWAGALEAERPRRGRSVALLLALAGLLRPEAWILALGYVAWLWWADRRIDPVVAALGVGAPLLWFLLDALVTGDPLFSLHQTSFVVDSIGEDVPVWRVPDRLVSFLGSTVRPPILVLGVVGLVLVWLDRRRRALRELVVPLALLVGGIVAFVGSAIAVGTVQQRYLTLPAVAICLFAAHALLGFRDRKGPFAARWRTGAIAVAVLGVLGGAVLLPGIVRRLTDELRFVRDSHDQLTTLSAVPRVGGCRPIVLPTYRGVPDLRWILDADHGGVRAAPAGPVPPGNVRIFVIGGDKPTRRFGVAAGVPFSTNDARRDTRAEIARTQYFLAKGGCRP
jgi:hypothetical protein